MGLANPLCKKDLLEIWVVQGPNTYYVRGGPPSVERLIGIVRPFCSLLLDVTAKLGPLVKLVYVSLLTRSTIFG